MFRLKNILRIILVLLFSIAINANAYYPDGIWIHNSAGIDTELNDSIEIKRMHIEDNNWDDIGYHFLIEQIDGEYQIIAGRSLQLQGSHVENFNDSIGICIVGNFDKQKPPEEAMKLLKQLVGGLFIIYGLTLEDVHFHNEVSTKTCPGLMFPEQEFIQSLTNHAHQ